ncbi:hypothetical protein HS7_11470 [Sulfolobales archaeon HS-7]|nr:hypothetical protein HS7_11470 [Sulfolobales archaeon HS-7]
MEFLEKKQRLVLIQVAKAGPGGTTLSELLELTYPVLTRETVNKILEGLYFSSLINVVRDEGEVRVIASKSVRTSVMYYEYYVSSVTSLLSKLKDVNDKNAVQDILIEFSSLLNRMLFYGLTNLPELYLPEMAEFLKGIFTITGDKLFPPVREDRELFLKLIEKYRGKADSSALALILKSAEGNSQSGNTTSPSQSSGEQHQG